MDAAWTGGVNSMVTARSVFIKEVVVFKQQH
jgi:hypothetical protein